MYSIQHIHIWVYRYTCVYLCLCMHILILEHIYNGLYVTKKQKHKLTMRQKKIENKKNIIKIFKTVEIPPVFLIKNNEIL